MQVLVQVLSAQRGSLRDAIVRDKKLKDYGLKVSLQKKPGRSHGWAKLHSTDGKHGAINIRWEGASRMLVCRVVTRGDGEPYPIIADFIAYLLARQQNRIEIMNVLTR